MKFEPNQLIDNRYQIIKKLDQGGMGAVWKATDTKLGDEVVLKIPLEVYDSGILRRFGDEIETMRKLAKHCPFVLNILDVGEINGQPFYVMQYQAGGSLRHRITQAFQESTPEDLRWTADSFQWLPRIAEALDYLHSKDFIHRDVKPENILFSESGNQSVPYLADFGIVKDLNSEKSMVTDPRTAIGSWGYWAREILVDGQHSPQSDQYALAVSVYEVISGEHPYAGSNLFTLQDAFKKGYRKLSDISGLLPSAASSAVDRALSQEAADRFGSCQEFAQAFQQGFALNDRPSEAPTGFAPIQGVIQSPVEGSVKPSEAVTGQHSPIGSSAVSDVTSESDSALEKYGGSRPPNDRLFSPPEPPEKAKHKKSKTKLVTIAATALLLTGLLATGAWYGLTMPSSEQLDYADLEDELENEFSIFSDIRGVEDGSLQSLADVGSVEAQLKLGCLYAVGFHVEKDGTEAVRWLEKAADQDVERNWLDDDKFLIDGSMIAQYWLGRLYDVGEIVEQNDTQAKEWYQKAADQKDPLAQFFLGRLLGSKSHSFQDPEAAVSWFRKAAKQESRDAQYYLGLAYRDGIGVVANQNKARKWLRRAAENGRENAERVLKSLQNGKDEEANQQTISMLEELANDGSLESQKRLAEIHAEGELGDVDLEEAFKWLLMAAKQGDAESQTAVGLSYSIGRRGTSRDLKEAVRWYQKAAEQDYADAQFSLGSMYHHGNGVDEDDNEAVRWYRKAADQGNSNAQNNLGMMYRDGNGVTKNTEEASRWFRAAAEQGDPIARANLKRLGH